MGAAMHSFDWARFNELMARGVPDELATLCSRMHVWRRPWGDHLTAWHASQDDGGGYDAEWIEYVPHVSQGIAMCPICCGIPEADCAWHGHYCRQQLATTDATGDNSP